MHLAILHFYLLFLIKTKFWLRKENSQDTMNPSDAGHLIQHLEYLSISPLCEMNIISKKHVITNTQMLTE